jgi:glutamate racemase
VRALEKSCPLLVPLVEEGWIDHPVTRQVVRIYLNELAEEASNKGLTPHTLVLGCTHYPLLRTLFEELVPSGMKVIDSAEATALAAVEMVSSSSASLPTAKPAELHFYATDSVEKFKRLGSRFLNRELGEVRLVDLGG